MEEERNTSTQDLSLANLKHNIIILNKESAVSRAEGGLLGVCGACLNAHIKVWVVVVLVVTLFTLGAILATLVTTHRAAHHPKCLPCPAQQTLTDACSAALCQHGGQCVVTPDVTGCVCPYQYTGQYCQTPCTVQSASSLSTCKDDICLNAGTCIEGATGQQMCVCSNGYYGAKCENEVMDPCIDNPCLHGGSCIPDYKCACSANFTGRNCKVKNMQTEIVCPENFVNLSTGCYMFVTDKGRSWYQANRYCGDLGARLVVIDTQQKQNAIAHYLKTRRGDCGNLMFWIGLRDSAHEGVFRWVATDEVTEFTAWANCEPNDANSGEDCAELRQSYGFLWNDAQCSKKENMQYAVCEYYKTT